MSGDDGLITDAWSKIAHAPMADGEQWRALALPISFSSKNERAIVQAIDQWGQHHVLVPAEDVDLPVNKNSPLAVSVREFRFGNAETGVMSGLYLDIHCRVPALNTQFDLVITDVVDAVKEARRPDAAAAAAVADWRRLFMAISERGPLTYREKLAAFGELSVVLDLSLANRGFRIQEWTGPLLRPHDFEMPEVSLEVKSVGDDSDTITIHGLSQLESTEGKALVLILRRLIESPNGQTVPELLKALVAVTDDAYLARDRAARLGVYEGLQDSTRFEVVETLFGEVKPGFPRIAVQDLPADHIDAIKRVTYDLALSELVPYLEPGTVEHAAWGADERD